MPVMKFGRFNGCDYKDVPQEYLEWMLSTRRQELHDVETELDRRAQLADADASWVDRIVTTGYRALTKQHHPDVGGSTDDMKEINLAAEQLRQILRDRR